MERTHQTVELVDSLPVCTHIFANSRRHCRQAVAKLGDLFCATHARSHALVTPANDPLEELVTELGDASEIQQVSRFLAKVLKLACQNRISIRRAAALTYIANSLLNSIRLINVEQQLAANAEPEKLTIDWTGIPRPDRDKIRLATTPPIADSVTVPAPA